MLNIKNSMVNREPFPHVATHEALAPDLYAALKKEFPDDSLFEQQRARNGNVGSRTGQGFDLYRGDEAYDTLIRRSDSWRAFDEFINSRAFVELFLSTFGDSLEELGCRYTIDPESYRRDLIEPREVLTENAQLSDHLRDLTRQFWPIRKNAEVELFTRLDIHRARTGYAKAAHCDRPNRVCTLVMYFCDADELGIRGGDLTLHKHQTTKPIANYERHPDPRDLATVAEIRPKDNLAVYFPCCNNSYHGVTAVESSNVARDYVYISVSAKSYRLW